MTKMGKTLAIVSLVLFLVSFFVTAVRLEVDSLLGWRISLHGSVSGWQAAWGALVNARDAIEDPGSVLGALHAVTNVLMVVGLVLLLGSHRVSSRWPAHALLAATVFNASLLFSLQSAAVLGYYLWLASFLGVTVCLYTRTRASAAI
jgi:hypothetical protein